MSMISRYHFDPRAIFKAIRLGVARTEEEAVEVLTLVTDRAALVTSPHGNRRYGDLFFKIDAGVVMDVEIVGDGEFCATCHNTGIVDVYPRGTEVCPDCGG